jgi:hypothetical protein
MIDEKEYQDLIKKLNSIPKQAKREYEKGLLDSLKNGNLVLRALRRSKLAHKNERANQSSDEESIIRRIVIEEREKQLKFTINSEISEIIRNNHDTLNYNEFELPQTSEEEIFQQQEPQNSRRYWWESNITEPIVIGLFLLIIWVGYLAIFTDNNDRLIFGDNNRNDGSSERPTCSGKDTEAYVMAQEAVKIMLKNPSGADFSYSSSDRLVREDPSCTYHVASWVDATNSFGGTVRRRWAMVLKRNVDGSWERIDGPIFE